LHGPQDIFLTADLAMALNQRDTLSPLEAKIKNRSTSSLHSEAATFHSAQAGPSIEMEQSKDNDVLPTKPYTDLTSTTMSRTDSGYEAGHERRSMSSSSSRSRRPRQSISSASGRPNTKRSSRSAICTSTHRTTARPAIQSRYSASRVHEQTHSPTETYQFFQFPSLAASASTASESRPQSHDCPATSTQPHPPPATVHYFLLPETRQLEYAAIDAASRGVRGFITKLIPNCILPSEYRRTKFHNGDDADSDVGSVRRYRLDFPNPEKGLASSAEGAQRAGPNEGRPRNAQPGLWKRMMGRR
jgi:hypothetical protein